MPVNSQALTGAITAKLTSKRITGRNARDLAASVGSSLASYVKTRNAATATLNGTAGPTGTITSIAVIGLTSVAMSGLMLTRASTLGFTGSKLRNIFDGISGGVTTVLQTMLLRGTAAGCAVGAGTAKFTAINSTAYKAKLEAEMARRGLRGRDKGKLADAIAYGIINHLLSSVTFTVTVAGSIAPTPPTGPISVVSIPSVTTSIT